MMSPRQDLREKYLSRLDELIAEGQAMLAAKKTERIDHGRWASQRLTTKEVVDSVAFEEWQTKASTVLVQVVPANHVHRRAVESLASVATTPARLQYALSLMKAIRDDYEKGFLGDLPLLARAEVAAGYLEQRELLLEKGYHVAAAVLGGAVLEDALRKLCDQRGIPTETEKGKRKTIGPINTELAKANVYNAAKAAEIRGWAALRNNAAHGDGDKNDPEAVKRMIEGVRSFVGDYLK